MTDFPKTRDVPLGWRLTSRILAELRFMRIVQLSPKGRLSQYVERIEPHLRMKWLKWKYMPPWLVYVNPVSTCNNALRDLFARSVFMVDERQALWLRRILWKLSRPAAEWQQRSRVRASKRWADVWNTSSSTSDAINWIEETRDLLKKSGCDASAQFVLLALRDQSYYEYLRASNGPARPGPEASQDTQVRNPNPSAYLPACRLLRERGLSVIRVGVNQTPLDASWEGVVSDYACSVRSERGDLLLARGCKFLITGGSGFWQLTTMFNRPNLSTDNYVPFLGPCRQVRDLTAWQMRRKRGWVSPNVS